MDFGFEQNLDNPISQFQIPEEGILEDREIRRKRKPEMKITRIFRAILQKTFSKAERFEPGGKIEFRELLGTRIFY